MVTDDDDGRKVIMLNNILFFAVSVMKPFVHFFRF
jgi:hypothetical protein